MNNELKPGTIVSSAVCTYRVVKTLGKGGYGITYLCKGKITVHNIETEADFALKEHFPSHLVNRDTTQSDKVSCSADKHSEYAGSRQDFIREATRLQTFGKACRNIVGVNEVFEANNTAYYVMQYINGMSAEQYVRSGGLSLDEALEILLPVIDAVKYLHDSNTNHLDIKPDNIMLHRSEGKLIPILIDFGQCIHFKKNGGKTSPKSSYGISEGYAPLEQYAGIRNFSPASDVYALGATLFYLLTGQTPVSASEVSEEAIRRGLRNVSDSHVVDAICKAMRRDSSVRTQDVSTFRKELLGKSEDVRSGGGGTKPLDPDGDRDNKKKWFKLAALGVGVAVLVGIGVRLGRGEQKEESTDIVDTLATDSATVVPQLEFKSKDTDTVTTPEPKVEEQKTPEVVKPEPKPESKPEPKPKPAPEPAVKSGTLSLGYATWTGGIQNGKPNGNGTMTYHSTHAIGNSGHTASAGDRFRGYVEGSHYEGTLIQADGTQVQIY